MKKIIIFCNTYYQLIVAIQMRLTIKKNDKITVIVTDECKNADGIVQRLKNVNLFDKVCFMKTKVEKQDVSFRFKINAIYRGVFGFAPNGINKYEKYDEIIGFNMDLPTHYVFATLLKRNKNIICRKMEEGLLSYNSPSDTSGLLTLIYQIRSKLKKRNLRDSIKDFYCFNTEMYSGEFSPIAIPKIDNDNIVFKEILEKVFSIDKNKNPYVNKIIFLSCVYDFEGEKTIGELAAAKKIAEKVGYENLIVKVHPRDNPLRFEKEGLTVDKNFSIPWEAMCMCKDLSKNILISTLSGSILNISGIFSKVPRCYYIYPLCRIEENSLALHFKNVIEKYLTSNEDVNFDNIKILYDLDSLDEIKIH